VAEVLLWVAPGKTNGEIGIILGISESTGKKHVLEVFEVLGVETRSAATLRVIEVLSAPGLRKPGSVLAAARSALRACLKKVWLPRARPRPSSFVLGFAGNFEDEDEGRGRGRDANRIFRHVLRPQ
jgi:hypothetical protein